MLKDLKHYAYDADKSDYMWLKAAVLHGIATPANNVSSLAK